MGLELTTLTNSREALSRLSSLSQRVGEYIKALGSTAILTLSQSRCTEESLWRGHYGEEDVVQKRSNILGSPKSTSPAFLDRYYFRDFHMSYRDGDDHRRQNGPKN